MSNINQNNKQLLFSIIVPVYNTEKWLNKCIDSILSQTYKDFELILVDDGSTDGSEIICDNYKRKDSRVKVIHKENGGHNSARNLGFENANGKYIVSVDSDDWLNNNALSEFHNILCEQPNVDIIIFGFKESKNNTINDCPIRTKFLDSLVSKEQLKKDIYPYMIFDPKDRVQIYAAGWNKVIKKSLLLKHCCYDYSIKVGGDFAYSYECCYYANSIYFLNKNLYYYNCDVENSVSAGSTKLKNINNYRYAKHRLKESKEIQKQLDADLASVIWILVARKNSKKQLKEYFDLKSLKPEVCVNELMNKRQKFVLNCIKEKKYKKLTGPSIYKLYRTIDFWLWKILNK